MATPSNHRLCQGILHTRLLSLLRCLQVSLLGLLCNLIQVCMLLRLVGLFPKDALIFGGLRLFSEVQPLVVLPLDRKIAVR